MSTLAPPRAPADRRGLVLVAVPAVLAAAALLWWGRSPAAGWLDHDRTGPVAFGTFTVAWLLMTVATMLPTALPLLSAYGTLTAGRPHPARLRAAVVAGFLAVWTVAGLAAAAVVQAVHRVDAPEAAVAAGVLAAAGAYQLSGLAARCLTACRNPVAILHRHWGGGRDVLRRSAAIGVTYGRTCLGCCAGLMGVMLVVGMGNLAWMYVLALLAAVQKAGGHRVARVAGGVLLVAAGLVAVRAVAG